MSCYAMVGPFRLDRSLARCFGRRTEERHRVARRSMTLLPWLLVFVPVVFVV